jgi:hypothetical protein
VCQDQVMEQSADKVSVSRSDKWNKPQSNLVCQDQVTEQSVDKVSVSRSGNGTNRSQS